MSAAEHAEPLAWPTAKTKPVTMEFTADLSPETFQLVFGIDPSVRKERPVAITYTTTERVPLVSTAPPRLIPGWRARLTLANVRAWLAWRWKRARWVAAGSPHRDVQHVFHLPSARLHIEEPTP